MGIDSFRSEPPGSDDFLALARAGDAQAFCRLAALYQNRLLAQARGLARDLASAEDLASETLAEAWRSLGRYNGTCRFSTWLFSILLHRFQKQVRSARRRPLPMSELSSSESAASRTAELEPAETARSPAEEAMGSEAVEMLRNALGELPEKHQQVLLLRFFEDASLPEMAEVLGCSVGTVKSRLHYAIEGLRQRRHKLNLSELRRDT